MGKASKRHASSSSSNKPYTGRSSAAKDAASKTVNKVFKMNTDLGQHILKNPGVAQAIVDKANLKQSDVPSPKKTPQVNTRKSNPTARSSSKSAPEPATSP